MATVYLAQDLKHDRDVAIKVLKAELGAVLGAERFLSEIRVTANLQHPNLLPLFDSGTADGFFYYVMPYVEGETLRAVLDRDPQLPVDEVLRLVGLLAGALDYAHARGVVHRDLKPENILLQAGQPVVADFGIALAVAQAGGARITETGLSLGTPHYMSPEQAAGDRAVDARSDQYSLAAICYEMLTGEPPHTGATSQAIIARLMTEPARSIRTVRPAVSSPMDRAVLRALSKTPADRFSSCGDFARAVAAPAMATSDRSSPRKVGIALGMIALLAASAWWWTTTRPGNTTTASRSIAVLPLVNVGGDSTQEYFADGMTDELTDALGKVPGLKVAARTSAFSFKGQANVDVREVGEKLGVGVVLEGSVRRSGDQVKVSVQLIDAAKRVELWSESYDRGVTEIFAVQDSITAAIVKQLALQLGGSELAATKAGRTNNPRAHDLYLQGIALVHQGSHPALRRALDYFQSALAQDSGYAQAYEGIGWVYGFLADTYMLPSLAYDSAGIAARKAIDLGGPSGDTQLILGYSQYVLDWDLAAAHAEAAKAPLLSPNSVDVRALYSNFLCVTGQFAEGMSEADKAIALDPLSPLGGWVREWCLYMQHRYDEVIAQHAKTAAIDPTFIYLDSFLGAALREKGQYSTTRRWRSIVGRRGTWVTSRCTGWRSPTRGWDGPRRRARCWPASRPMRRRTTSTRSSSPMSTSPSANRTPR